MEVKELMAYFDEPLPELPPALFGEALQAQANEHMEELFTGNPDILVSKPAENAGDSSAFSEENYKAVMIIGNMRIYDLLLALLASADPDKAEALRAMHESGMTFCPAPSYVEYEDVPS